MKIEICEQMVQSWLINIQQCQVVQTNWAISPLRSIGAKELEDAYEFVKQIQDVLNEKLSEEIVDALQASIDEDSDEQEPKKAKTKKTKKLDIVKKSKSKQFIYQCEIDVAGIRLDDGIVDRVFLVDSAFHKKGLGYHDVVATVVKKLIRAVTVATIIFGNAVDVTIAFASPECRDTVKNEIENVVDMLQALLVGKYSKISLELYFNEKFTSEIYEPLKKNVDALNNDNDLFMRALNLVQSAEKYSSTPSVAPAPATPKTTRKASKKSSSAPTIIYTPSDPDVFKSELMSKKRAEIIWIYNDGTRHVNLWKADNVKPSTNINGNIQSRNRWRTYVADGLKEVYVKIL